MEQRIALVSYSLVLPTQPCLPLTQSIKNTVARCELNRRVLICFDPKEAKVPAEPIPFTRTKSFRAGRRHGRPYHLDYGWS